MDSIAANPTMVEQVYRAILDAICDGVLAPGERLTQEGVAKKLNVSRQPVNQALMLLKQQKFVCEAGRRGLMVAPVDREFMRWVYELRLGIEPIAAALAARHATDADCDAGRARVQRGRAALRDGAIGPLIGADMAFHMWLYTTSGNRLFVDTMEELWHHLRRAMREVLMQRDYRKSIWAEHEHILRAITSHDEHAAASLVRAHLRSAALSVEVSLPVSGE
ncbi:MAG: GntR family transcriptional regulator [Burkholderiales bacterium]|nr:GntR family transcriptional regulator [Burkholderiales bacterium]